MLQVTSITLKSDTKITWKNNKFLQVAAGMAPFLINWGQYGIGTKLTGKYADIPTCRLDFNSICYLQSAACHNVYRDFCRLYKFHQTIPVTRISIDSELFFTTDSAYLAVMNDDKTSHIYLPFPDKYFFCHLAYLYRFRSQTLWEIAIKLRTPYSESCCCAFYRCTAARWWIPSKQKPMPDYDSQLSYLHVGMVRYNLVLKGIIYISTQRLGWYFLWYTYINPTDRWRYPIVIVIITFLCLYLNLPIALGFTKAS